MFSDFSLLGGARLSVIVISCCHCCIVSSSSVVYFLIPVATDNFVMVPEQYGQTVESNSQLLLEWARATFSRLKLLGRQSSCGLSIKVLKQSGNFFIKEQ